MLECDSRIPVPGPPLGSSSVPNVNLYSSITGLCGQYPAAMGLNCLQADRWSGPHFEVAHAGTLAIRQPPSPMYMQQLRTNWIKIACQTFCWCSNMQPSSNMVMPQCSKSEYAAPTRYPSTASCWDGSYRDSSTPHNYECSFNIGGVPSYDQCILALAQLEQRIANPKDVFGFLPHDVTSPFPFPMQRTPIIFTSGK